MITCARANKGEEREKERRERREENFFSDCRAITIHRKRRK